MKNKYWPLVLSIIAINNLIGQSIIGIDVSHYQGNINWQQVYNDGKVFAFVKATEGMTYQDPNFSTYMTNGNNAGVIMGTYHFARPDNNTASQDANNFLSVASSYIGTGFLPPVLDIEDPYASAISLSSLCSWIQSWVSIVYNATGVEPIIYTSGYYASNLCSSLNTYKLWIADPDGCATCPPPTGNWSTWAFKQYSWNGSVAGISGNVDLDVFNGSITDFNNLVSSNSPSLDCSNAVILNCGTTYHGSSSNANSNVTTYGCNNWTETGPERVHKITPSSNGILTATISNFSGDLDVYILGSCDPSDCLGSVSSSSASYSNALAGHTYYIIVDADDGSGSSYDLFVDCPNNSNSEDIYLTNEIITSSTNVNPGGTVVAEVDQNYSGSSNSVPDVYLYYYLSSDCYLDGSDIFLDDDFSTIDINDPTDGEIQTLTIPNGTTPGIYYILFVGDATDVVNESNENNNTACVQINVIGNGSEDIYLSNAGITSSTSISAGETVDVEVDQNYYGGSSSVPDIYIYYYLSTDCYLDGSDIFLDDDFSTINANDPTDGEAQTLIIPNGTNLGQYYILFVADATNVINESNENNNTACVPIFITGIEDLTLKEKVNLFPNPVHGILNYKVDQSVKIERIVIINELGQDVLIVVNPNNQLDVSNLLNGIYLIKFIDNNKKEAIFKIIKN